MKRLQLSCLFLAVFALLLHADFQAGLDAYKKGDFAAALKEWQPLADKGDANAEYNLGLLYARGQGVPQDYKQAAEWYRKSAEHGVASAQFNLGVMFDLGQGVQRNFQEALQWYRKAAGQGYASAMTNIGILYYNAQGVPRDLVEAYAWFSRAAKAGDPRAPQLVKVVADRIKPADLRRAEQLASDWHPSKPAGLAEDTDRLFIKPASTQVASAAPGPSVPAAPQSPTPQSPAPQGSADRSAPAVQDVWTGVARIVAVGDVHGDFEQFVALLESANLIDGSGNWIGGKTHLVQTGDVVDRGPDSRKVMDLLMKLEKQAAAAGGYVHCLIGNHEAMDVYGDLRYVSPGEFSAFRTDKSDTARDFSYSQAMAAMAKPDLDREHWNREHPPGFAEHRQAFSPGGEYGRWITGHNTAIKIGDTLFVHAGISRKYAGWPLEKINGEVRHELTHFDELHGGIVTDEQGPLWYGGLAKGDETQLAPLVDTILSAYGVKRIVIGHTYADAAITPRFGGKVILIDIGLSRIYDNIGKLGCLVIENNNAYALHRGQALALPKDEGPDMLRYLKQAAALDPKPSPLNARIEALEKARQ